MTLDFSFATKADVQSLVTLVNSAYRGDTSRLGWTTEAHFLDGQRTDSDEILNKIQTKNSYIVVGKNDDGIIGCCEIVADPQSHDLYFGMFSILPTLQNKGLGKLFLNHIEFLASQWQLKRIKMTVITLRTELIDYYKRRGYTETDQFIPFPEEDRFGIPKVDGLKMVYLTKDIV